MNHEDETNLKLLIAFASFLQFHDYRHVPLNQVEPSRTARSVVLNLWGRMALSEGSPKIIRNIRYLCYDS